MIILRDRQKYRIKSFFKYPQIFKYPQKPGNTFGEI